MFIFDDFRPENTDENTAQAPEIPQVTYEICTPRDISQYPNHHQEKYSGYAFKDTHKSRKSKHRNPLVTDTSWVEEDADSVERMKSSSAHCIQRKSDQIFDIGCWIKEPAKKQGVKACRKTEARALKEAGKKGGDVEEDYVIVPLFESDVSNWMRLFLFIFG